MHRSRKSGIVVHPTSLPGAFGIGDLGPEAYRFVDFLAETGQSLGRSCLGSHHPVRELLQAHPDVARPIKAVVDVSLPGRS